MFARLGAASESSSLVRFAESSIADVVRETPNGGRTRSGFDIDGLMRGLDSVRVSEAIPLASPSIAPPRPRVPRFPILLAHGYLGIRFRGIREHLESLGCRVHVLSVSATAGVAVRAAELARQVNGIHAERVNIVAHSMGGLDARYAISKLGLAPRVASLVTVGTPHRGTPLADLVDYLPLLAGEGLRDLTLSRADAFNSAVPDVQSVVYGSFVGVSSGSQRGFFSPLHEYLRGVSGPNDGVVPAHSQRWGRVLGEVDADHLAQIGWSRRFDPRALYAALVTHVVSFGC